MQPEVTRQFRFSRPKVKVTPHPNPPGWKGEYEFTPGEDWFSGRRGVWWRLMEGMVGWATYLEIGVYEGRSITWICENLKPASAIGVDPYPQPSTRENLRRVNARFQQTTGRHFLLETAARYSNTQWDIIYIDGDHRARPTLEHAVLAFPLLAPGGLMIFDDYYWHAVDRPEKERPQLAVDVFWELYGGAGGEMEVVHWDWQVILRRRVEEATL